MQYLRRSVAFFFALQQLKLDLATISADQYAAIFNRLSINDPGMQVLLTKVLKAKHLLLPFIHHKEGIQRVISDVDHTLVKHPLYKWSLTQCLLVSSREVMLITDPYVREEWTQEMREDELHFMFSLVSLLRYHKDALCKVSVLDNHFNVDFVVEEAFIVLKEYRASFGEDSVYWFYHLAFTDLPKPKKGAKEKGRKP